MFLASIYMFALCHWRVVSCRTRLCHAGDMGRTLATAVIGRRDAVYSRQSRRRYSALSLRPTTGLVTANQTTPPPGHLISPIIGRLWEHRPPLSLSHRPPPSLSSPS